MSKEKPQLVVAEMRHRLGKMELSETSLHDPADVPMLWTALSTFLLN